ncbi:lipopolysaccharide biosynthesis protein [Sphingobium sp. IP1]|uniref:lipopolysaccharide biosynthesis protein n=1 Tax=Sphingobium sp. IP1 TaxID=2021637 RepID=UPI0015D4C0B4|nr:lipopolysaccharide biosynthesis protein [Sphingobium sp. IP1]
MSSLKSTAIYLPGILLPRVAALGLIILMTHLLPKAEYGLLTLVITVGELVDTSLTTWVRLALLRLGAGGQASRGLANVVLSLVALMTALGAGVSLIISLVLVPDRPLQFWIAVLAYVVSITSLRVGLALLQLNDRNLTYSVLEMCRAVLSFAAAMTAAVVINDNFLAPSLAAAMSTFVVAMIALHKGYKGLHRTEQKFSFRDIVVFAGPLLFLSALAIFANAMDRLILQYMAGAAAVGAYAAVYAIARQPIDVLANSLNAGGYPALVRRYETGGQREAAALLSHQLGFLSKLLLPPACVMLVMQQDLAHTLLPREYAEQSGPLFAIILAGALAFNFRTVIFDNIFHLERRYRIQLQYFVFVLAAGTVLAAIAIPRFGVIGAALVFVTWTTLALMLSWFYGRSLIPVKLPNEDIGYALLLSGACSATVSVVLWLMHGQPHAMRLIAGGLVATLTYLLLLAVIHREVAKEFIRQRDGATRAA